MIRPTPLKMEIKPTIVAMEPICAAVAFAAVICIDSIAIGVPWETTIRPAAERKVAQMKNSQKEDLLNIVIVLISS